MSDVKAAIVGASIALRAHKRLDETRELDEYDMRLIDKEAQAIAALWAETQTAFCSCGHLHREHSEKRGATCCSKCDCMTV